MRMNKAGAGSRISGDRIFNGFNMVFLTILTIIIVFPIWNVIVNSFSSAQAVAGGKSIFWPAEFFTGKLQGGVPGYFHLDGISGFGGQNRIGCYLPRAFLRHGCLWHEQGISEGKKAVYGNGRHNHVFFRGHYSHLPADKSLGMLNSFWVYIIPAAVSPIMT